LDIILPKYPFIFTTIAEYFEGEKEQINDGDANVKQRQISLNDLISLVGHIGLSSIMAL